MFLLFVVCITKAVHVTCARTQNSCNSARVANWAAAPSSTSSTLRISRSTPEDLNSSGGPRHHLFTSAPHNQSITSFRLRVRSTSEFHVLGRSSRSAAKRRNRRRCIPGVRPETGAPKTAGQDAQHVCPHRLAACSCPYDASSPAFRSCARRSAPSAGDGHGREPARQQASTGSPRRHSFQT